MGGTQIFSYWHCFAQRGFQSLGGYELSFGHTAYHDVCFLHAASSNYITLNFGRHSLKEVLDAPNVMNMIKDTKAAQEVI